MQKQFPANWDVRTCKKKALQSTILPIKGQESKEIVSNTGLKLDGKSKVLDGPDQRNSYQQQKIWTT